MSIRGIDTQLMVNRTMDLAKDVNVMNRRDTVAQEQFAQELKVASEEQQEQVQNVEEQAEGGKIRNDEKPREDRKHKKGGDEKQAADRSSREDVALDASLAPGEDDSGMRIDIRV